MLKQGNLIFGLLPNQIICFSDTNEDKNSFCSHYFQTQCLKCPPFQFCIYAFHNQFYKFLPILENRTDGFFQYLYCKPTHATKVVSFYRHYLSLQVPKGRENVFINLIGRSQSYMVKSTTYYLKAEKHGK